MKSIFLWALSISATLPVFAQVRYGNNATAGGYYNCGDARIYYEVYGSGSPVVLLHGGIYGYIDEYSEFIPVLSRHHQVIAIATRGHGKSELGHQPLTNQLFASDAFQVIRHLTKDSVAVIGFSDGGDTGYYLAAEHPELVKQLIAIGGNFGYDDFDAGDKAFIDGLSAASMEKNDQAFVSERKALMPDPGRFGNFITAMSRLWKDKVYVGKETITTIKCPTLIVAGQNDGCPIERYIALYRLLAKGQIAIIPASDHLVLVRQPMLMKQIIQANLNDE